MVQIAPSMLSADYAALRRDVEELEKAGADLIHWDIMDGHYVPNLTFGPGIVKQLRPYSKLPFDVHLMVTNPDEMIPWFVSAGADIITVHAEVCVFIGFHYIKIYPDFISQPLCVGEHAEDADRTRQCGRLGHDGVCITRNVVTS